MGGAKRTAASVTTEASQLGFLVLLLSSRSSPRSLLFFSFLLLLATLISSAPLVSLGATLCPPVKKEKNISKDDMVALLGLFQNMAALTID